MTDAATPHDPAGERLLSRLLFFSDAVFAIVLTLLALEMRPPESHGETELTAGLWAMRYHFLAFATSFALVGVFWIAHLSIMRVLSAFDWRVAFANLVFLLVICVMPFASALLGENGPVGIVWRIYCAALISASVTQTLLLTTIAAAPNNLTARDFWYRILRSLSPGIAFAAGLGLSLAGYDTYAFFCWTLIPVIFLIARLALGPRRARA